MNEVVYIGPEVDGLYANSVYVWKGDFGIAGHTWRRIHSDYAGSDWFVNPLDAPMLDKSPKCPICGGERGVPVAHEVNYGPHPDAPEYGDWIGVSWEFEECGYCHGIGVVQEATSTTP